VLAACERSVDEIYAALEAVRKLPDSAKAIPLIVKAVYNGQKALLAVQGVMPQSPETVSHMTKVFFQGMIRQSVVPSSLVSRTKGSLMDIVGSKNQDVVAAGGQPTISSARLETREIIDIFYLSCFAMSDKSVHYLRDDVAAGSSGQDAGAEKGSTASNFKPVPRERISLTSNESISRKEKLEEKAVKNARGKNDEDDDDVGHVSGQEKKGQLKEKSSARDERKNEDGPALDTAPEVTKAARSGTELRRRGVVGTAQTKNLDEEEIRDIRGTTATERWILARCNNTNHNHNIKKKSGESCKNKPKQQQQQKHQKSQKNRQLAGGAAAASADKFRFNTDEAKQDYKKLFGQLKAQAKLNPSTGEGNSGTKEPVAPETWTTGGTSVKDSWEKTSCHDQLVPDEARKSAARESTSRNFVQRIESGGQQ